MKKTLFCVAMVAVIVGVLITSCKKEKETILNENGQSEMNNPQNNAVVSRILGFKKQVEARKANPGMKSGETLSLEDAMNNVVDLFNVTYTEPVAYYTQSEGYDFTVNVPLTADGMVRIDEAVAAYEQAVTAAREAYHASSLTDKAYKRLMVTCELQRDGSVAFHFDGQYGTKGEQPPTPQPHIDGPFGPDDNWRCGGRYQGKCDDPTVPGSADEKLTEQLYLKISGELPAVPEGCRATFVGNMEYIFSGPEYQGIYYTEDLDNTCISWMCLNDYYAGEINNIYRVVPERNGFSLTALYTFGRYYVVSASVVCEEQQSSPLCIKHATTVRYGRWGYVSEDEIGFENL